MSRRDRIDPETARLVEERLQWLLHEHGPVPERPPESPPRPSVSDGASDRAGPSDAARRPSGSRRSSPRPAADAAAPDHPEVPERSPGPSSDGRLLTTLTAFRRPHLVVVAVVVAVGILVAGWAVLRARPVAVADTPPVASSAPTGVPTKNPVEPGRSAGPSPSTAGVIVHVLGAVRKPGLVTLAAGSRVQDAIAAAGGLTAKADPGELNLAQAVTDGQEIVVGTKNKPAGEVRNGTAGGSSGGSGSGSGTGGPGQPVDLNTASQSELEELPGVGPVMAGKILAWRTENGRVSRVEELQEIDGVGPKTYAKLASLCRV